jgi:hypothetical protein
MRRKNALSLLGILAIGVVFLLATPSSVRAHKLATTLSTAQQQSVVTNLELYGGNTWDIAVDGDYVYTIASGTPNGFFYSTDAGANWNRPAGNNDYGSGQGVEVDPATGAVYVALGGSLYKSTDHGATLTLLKENAGNPLVYANDTILGGWNNTVQVSVDNGATWDSVTVGSTGNITSLAASKTAGTFYAVTYSGSTGNATLYRSVNNGTTWAAMAVTVGGSPIASFRVIQANPYNENILAVGNDSHTWMSVDAGATFTAITNAPAGCNTITTWNSLGRMYACSSYTDDGGLTWTQMNFDDIVRGPGKIIVVNSSDEDVLYADSMSGVTKSLDGGVTWANSYQGILGVNAEAISVTTDKTVAWVSSSNGLAKSENFNSGAPTWLWPILPCAPERCDPSGIGASVWVKPNNPNVVLAGSIGGYVFRSEDAGATWALASIPSIDVSKFIDEDSGMNILRPYQFASDPTNPSTVYVTMAAPSTGDEWIGVVLKSTDSGANWTDLNIADMPASSIAVSKTGILYVGTGYNDSTEKGVWKFRENVWERLSGIPTDVNINSIMVDPEDENFVYVAASGDGRLGHDGVYKTTTAGSFWTKLSGLSSYYEFDNLSIQRSTIPNTIYVTCRDGAHHGMVLKSSNAGVSWGILYQGLKNETYNSAVFDGLVVGSVRGVFSVKSKAKMTQLKANATRIVKGNRISFTGVLKDAATNKLLKYKFIRVYRKVGKSWVLINGVKTNNRGVFKVSVRPPKTTQYKLVWMPKRADTAEYAKVNSRIFKVTVRKK